VEQLGWGQDKMKINKKIGIIGNGFVGSAVRYGFSPNVGVDADVKVYDKNPNKSTHTLEEVVTKSDVIFLSVPTPSNKDGSMNLDIVDSALADISKYNFDGIILLRSTVVPGSTKKLSDKYSNLRIVFNPEFLTERSANFDFINQNRFILGGSSDDVIEVSELFRERFGSSLSIVQTNYETAELIKYMTNTFFATKISFLNDMKILADKCGVIWEDAVEGFVRDGRIGHSHLNVPGHDGKYGFGGSCFPKDIQALINFGESHGVNMGVLKSAWETNLKVRPERDWEELKGRAIVDE
jgi:UDPglucose 6-dehydrogenase